MGSYNTFRLCKSWCLQHSPMMLNVETKMRHIVRLYGDSDAGVLIENINIFATNQNQ